MRFQLTSEQKSAIYLLDNPRHMYANLFGCIRIDEKVQDPNTMKYKQRSRLGMRWDEMITSFGLIGTWLSFWGNREECVISCSSSVECLENRGHAMFWNAVMRIDMNALPWTDMTWTSWELDLGSSSWHLRWSEWTRTVHGALNCRP